MKCTLVAAALTALLFAILPSSSASAHKPGWVKQATTPPGWASRIVKVPANMPNRMKARNIDTTVRMTRGTTTVDLTDEDGVLSIKLPSGANQNTAIALKSALGTGVLDLNKSCIGAVQFNFFTGKDIKIEQDCDKPGTKEATVTTNFDVSNEIITQVAPLVENNFDKKVRRGQDYLRHHKIVKFKEVAAGSPK